MSIGNAIDLIGEIDEELEQRIADTEVILENTKREEFSFKTKNLVITGRDIFIRVPGRNPYNDINRVEAEYSNSMDVKINGLLVKIPPKSIGIGQGRIHIIGYRTNKTEEAFARKQGDIVVEKIFDPELTLYTNNGEIVLNQVIGMPVIYVSKGLLSYK